MGECSIYKEERDLLAMRTKDECDMEKFGTLDSREKTIAIVGDRWWAQKAKQQGDTYVTCRNVMSAQMLEVSRLGVGTVLRLERDAWAMLK